MWCAFLCSPNQASFVKNNSTNETDSYVVEICKGFGTLIYESCKDVIIEDKPVKDKFKTYKDFVFYAFQQQQEHIYPEWLGGEDGNCFYIS